MRNLLIFLSLISVICSAELKSSKPVQDCDTSDEGVVKYQDQILASIETKSATAASAPAESTSDARSLEDRNWLQRVSGPLHCLLEAQTQNHGLSHYLANNTLRLLFGAPLPEGWPSDARFEKVSDRLQRLSQKSPDLLNQSLVSEFSQGEWRLYSLFCDGKDNKGCSKMLPEDNDIRNSSPLLAAASLLHLRKAYGQVHGKQKQEIEARIKILYKTMPENPPLVRLMINQIYLDLFGEGPHLSLS